MQKRVAGTKAFMRPEPTVEPPKRGLEQLTSFRLVCETTGDSFDYDVPSDAATLKDLWDRELKVSCPHCRDIHGYLFRTMYVDAVLSGTRLTFDHV